MSTDRQPTVYIVDDDDAVRASLRFLIESIGLPVTCYPSADAFLDTAPVDAVGCLVLDVRMPGMSGLELLDRLGLRKRDLHVLVITGHADVAMAVRALKSGASDFIEKPYNDQALLDRIQRAMTESSAERAAREAHDGVGQRLEQLTDRERQVLDRVMVGEPNRVIAERLKLSEKTIEVHRSRVMRKMEADSLADLVRMIVLYEHTQEAGSR